VTSFAAQAGDTEALPGQTIIYIEWNRGS